MTKAAAPRIAPVSTPTSAQRSLLETASRGPGGTPRNVFLTMLHNPGVLEPFSELGKWLLTAGSLPSRQREIVTLRVGWKSGCVYEFGQHSVIGMAAGLTQDEIAGLASDEFAGWDEGDRALIAMVDELCASNSVSDATWNRLAGRWDASQLVELLVLAGFYRMLSGLLNAVGVELEPGVPGWPPYSGR